MINGEAMRVSAAIHKVRRDRGRDRRSMVNREEEINGMESGQRSFRLIIVRIVRLAGRVAQG